MKNIIFAAAVSTIVVMAKQDIDDDNYVYIEVTSQEQFTETTMEVAELYYEYKMQGISEQVQLVRDLLAVVCDEVNESGESPACDEVQGLLGGVITFISSDGETKKDMAIEWGEDKKDVLEAYWGKTSSNVVKWGNTVQTCVEDFWGEARLKKAENLGERIHDNFPWNKNKATKRMLHSDSFMISDLTMLAF